MRRVIEVDFETSVAKIETAFNRFFKKYPDLEGWRESFEWLAENGKDFECNNLWADGTKNNDWTYALHLDINEHFKSNKIDVYMCIIERA